MIFELHPPAAAGPLLIGAYYDATDRVETIELSRPASSDDIVSYQDINSSPLQRCAEGSGISSAAPRMSVPSISLLAHDDRYRFH